MNGLLGPTFSKEQIDALLDNTPTLAKLQDVLKKWQMGIITALSDLLGKLKIYCEEEKDKIYVDQAYETISGILLRGMTLDKKYVDGFVTLLKQLYVDTEAIYT